MEDIDTIYHNHFGIAFRWKKHITKGFNKIQLVFRDTGLLLTKSELVHFSKNIQNTFSNPTICHCKKNASSRSLLLQTPNTQTNLAVSFDELKNIEDLVNGTLFHVGLNRLLETKNIS